MTDFSLVRPATVSATEPELVWAFAFERAGPGQALSATPDLNATQGFVWLHLDLIHVSTRSWLNDMEATFGAAADALMSRDSHPHVDWAGDLLWGAARDIHREVNALGERSDDLRFILGPRFLVTGRRRPMQSAHAVKRKIETGAEYESSADLLEALLTEIAEAIGRVASRTGEQLETIEDRVFATTVTDERAALLGLRREVARYARLATSLRAVIGRLDQTGAAHLPHHCQGLTARLSQRVASLHADIHYLGDHARLLNDEVGVQVSAQANKHLFTLTVLTTLLLPPSLVTGYFGMNTKNLPFSESDYGTLFATLIAAGAALSVYLIMRRNRMLGA